MDDALAGFATLCPNITIEASTAPDPETQQTQYETAKLAGTEPDVVITNLFGKSTSWLANGATVDVAPYIEAWGLKSLIDPTALQQWTAPDGRIQGIPFEGFTWPVWYNTAILEEAGVTEVPKTTDELIDVATKVRAAGKAPFAIGGKDWNGNKLFSATIETLVSDEELIAAYTAGDWSNPKIKAGIELFTKLRDAGVFVDNAAGISVDEMVAQFYGGEAAIMFNGSWAYAGTPPELTSDVVLGGFPLPSDAVREKPLWYAAFTATSFWLSPNGEKNLDASRAFITYFYTPEVLGRFVEKAGIFVPVAFDKVEVDKTKLHPFYVQAAELPDSVTNVVLPDAYVPAASASGFERATSLAYTPGTSVDAIVTALQEAWQQ
jgi:multiple sugar transport system substrate-binding protein